MRLKILYRICGPDRSMICVFDHANLPCKRQPMMWRGIAKPACRTGCKAAHGLVEAQVDGERQLRPALQAVQVRRHAQEVLRAAAQSADPVYSKNATVSAGSSCAPA